MLFNLINCRKYHILKVHFWKLAEGERREWVLNNWMGIIINDHANGQFLGIVQANNSFEFKVWQINQTKYNSIQLFI